MKPRPPLPTFTEETARKKVQAAEDAWNSRDPERVSLAYTEDTPPVRTARGEEAVCLDPAADCFYRSTTMQHPPNMIPSHVSRRAFLKSSSALAAGSSLL